MKKLKKANLEEYGMTDNIKEITKRNISWQDIKQQTHEEKDRKGPD